eukprot:8105613-Heterocapsa_arctica.AAC.1
MRPPRDSATGRRGVTQSRARSAGSLSAASENTTQAGDAPSAHEAAHIAEKEKVPARSESASRGRQLPRGPAG